MIVESKEIELKTGQIITMRSPDAGDAEMLLRHLRSVFAESYLNMNHPSDYFDKFSVAEEEKILADFAASPSKFMLSAVCENEIVGNLVVFGSAGEFLKHNARLGMGLEKKFCGLGLGSALLEHALGQSKRFNFRRIELTVRTFNEAGIRLYEKVGFQKVGLLKSAALIDGRYVDEYMYQILLDKPEIQTEVQSLSIHDSILVSYTVTSQKREIVMQVQPEGDDQKLIEVTFGGVCAYQFNNDAFGTILYGIDEVDPVDVIKENFEQIQKGRIQSGWMGEWAADLESARAYFKREMIRGYEISSSVGLSGWVLSRSMTQA